MEISINFNKQLIIPLSFDDDEASYKGWYNIEVDNYMITFYLSVSINFKSFFGDYYNPPPIEEVSRDIAVTNLKVIDEDSNDINFNYLDLEKQIIESVSY